MCSNQLSQQTTKASLRAVSKIPQGFRSKHMQIGVIRGTPAGLHLPPASQTTRVCTVRTGSYTNASSTPRV